MDRVHVNSSQIESVGYDSARELLEIEFKSGGGVYQYQNVNNGLYEDLMAAPSVGGFFTSVIKKNPNQYPHNKVVEQKGKWTVDTVGKAKAVKPAPSTPAPADIEAKALTLPDKARKLTITNNQQYAAAAEFLKSVKGLRDEVNLAFDPIIAKAHEAHKTAIEQKRKAEVPLVEAERIVKATIGGYLDVKEQERQAAERRLKKEHEDRIRAQADEENLKRAQILADQGRMDEAAAAVDAEVVVPDLPVHVESTVPKVSGISKRVLYVVADVDLMRLAVAVANGNAPVECLQPNNVFLNAQARAFKKTGELFPGVVVRTEDNIAAGSK